MRYNKKLIVIVAALLALAGSYFLLKKVWAKKAANKKTDE